MDKETLSHYGWIVVLVLVLSVLLAMATPFGRYIATAIENTTQGLFEVQNKALNAADIEQMENEWDDYLNGSNGSGGIGTETPSEPEEAPTDPEPTECQHTNTTLSNESDATCTTAGYTGDTYCNDCDTTIATGTSIPETGHSYSVTDTVDATCTNTGAKTYTCNNCGDSYNEAVSAIGHTEVIDDAVSATCTATGWTEGSHCGRCDTVLVAQSVIPTTGHTFDSASDMSCNGCKTTFTAYAFQQYDYDTKMGTTTLSDAHIVIPETFEYNGTHYKVTSITSYGCSKSANLISITIPKSITTIKEYAFYECPSLKTVIFEENSELKTIDRYAFWYCSALSTITIPSKVTSIGQQSFAQCTSLRSINIPNSVTSISYNAFWETNLTSATFENTSGWTFASSTNSTELSADSLANTSTAATYLKSTYRGGIWTRS